MSKAKRRGDVAPPEIVAQARIAAGILAEIFGVDKDELLDRPRPSGKLRCVRDVLIGVLHHKLGISQQKIAAALGRDRGVISDAAHAIDDATTGDANIRFAFAEIHEKIADVMTMAEAWNEAINQETVAAAIAEAAKQFEEEADEDEALERDIADDEAERALARPKMRCHSCHGKGAVRMSGIGDPAYRAAWEAAQKSAPAPDGFHMLTCKHCKGAGERQRPPAASTAAAILGAPRE